MKASIYTEIKTQLLAVTAIKSVRIWNRQIENQDRIIAVPACFVEFGRIPYQTVIDNSQETDKFNFIVHLIVETIDEGNEESVFPLSQEIFKKLQQAGAERTFEQIDHNHTNYIDMLIGFELYLTGDDYSKKGYSKIKKSDLDRPHIT